MEIVTLVVLGGFVLLIVALIVCSIGNSVTSRVALFEVTIMGETFESARTSFGVAGNGVAVMSTDEKCNLQIEYASGQRAIVETNRHTMLHVEPGETVTLYMRIGGWFNDLLECRLPTEAELQQLANR